MLDHFAERLTQMLAPRQVVEPVVDGLVDLGLRARSADRRLREAIRGVCDELVVRPVEAELEAYAAVRGGLAQALKR